MATVSASAIPAPPSAAVRRGVAALVLFYAAFYGLLSWQRFATFHAQIDMSYYLRLVWGVGHGHYDLPLVRAPHVLGLHLEPILLPLALLSRLGAPLPQMLLGVQAAAVALLVWPASRLGARHLGRGGALLGALVALLYPTVTVATLHDFHAVTLALAPLLGVLDALDEGRWRRALWLGGLALLCREDIALQLAAVYLAYGLAYGLAPPAGRALPPRRWLLLLCALLGAYFFAYVLWLQPRFLPAAGSYGLHFGKFGSGAPAGVRTGRDMLWAMLGHPLALLRHLLTLDRLLYPVLLLWPLGLLPLLRPRPLWGALPVLAINLLSDFPRVRTLESHYTTALVPFVLAAGLLGAGRLRRWCERRRAPASATPIVWLWLLLPLSVAHLLHGGSPLALRSERFAWELFRAPAAAACIRQALRGVAPTAQVAARPGPLAHLAERPRAISPPEYDDGRPVDVALPLCY